ncbi:MAG: sigma-70 family RNA polymerase sigma factor [Steroidobacter sp.]
MSKSLDRSIELTGGASALDARRRFETHCAPFKADLYRFVYWLCRDRTLAEDVMQETLLRAWRSIDSLGDVAAARPWLLTIARRELARVFERKRLPTVDIDAVADSGDAALAVSESHELEDMRRAIGKLEVIYREPLMMQVLLGFSTEEIARELDISVAAVLTRLFRARQLLRKQLVGAIDAEDVCE